MKIWRNQNSEHIVRGGITKIFPRLWRYCLVLTSDTTKADDLAQAACLRALERAHSFEAGSHFDRWLFRLTQRLWIDEIRKVAVRRGGGLSSIEEVDLMDLAPNPEQQTLNREILMGIMRLPEAQRVAILLVYVEGHSYRDAADILGIPVGTVMSRLSVARGKLVETFSDRAEVG
ncbi:MAG: RNA polymerase sigma factor [Pseudomonadota bacterium]